ncbi:hypothetical protein DAEQUDRAFT_732093 [Daedalea quercina L-15889]|uniref:Uncharacterized protein n=1 Tax=Daedalea quercina L-15889 TaxID=1314783 RepID=A0A165LV21_9APHY|nr:hypothetical protein DAEQUDRAFT_732093 [Daedalea quercina L-15889]
MDDSSHLTRGGETFWMTLSSIKRRYCLLSMGIVNTIEDEAMVLTICLWLVLSGIRRSDAHPEPLPRSKADHHEKLRVRRARKCERGWGINSLVPGVGCSLAGIAVHK